MRSVVEIVAKIGVFCKDSVMCSVDKRIIKSMKRLNLWQQQKYPTDSISKRQVGRENKLLQDVEIE